MSILCLTGWQQKRDALSDIAPEAEHFDYAAYADVETMFAALPKAPTLAIGWSLGGQLLVRAVAGGHIQPKTLLLLAVPFQCVADDKFAHGMNDDDLKQTRRNYSCNPKETAAYLNSLIGVGDVYATRIIRTLNEEITVWDKGLVWLDELGKATCRTLSFSDFPNTIIVHGAQDRVIPPANAAAFAEKLPHAQLQMWPDCAHAPHLHDSVTLRKIITRYV